MEWWRRLTRWQFLSCALMKGSRNCPLLGCVRGREVGWAQVIAAMQSYRRRHWTGHGWSMHPSKEICPDSAAGQHPDPTSARIRNLAPPSARCWIEVWGGPGALSLANPRFCAPSAGCIFAGWCPLFVPERMLKSVGTILREVIKLTWLLFRVLEH